MTVYLGSFFYNLTTVKVPNRPPSITRGSNKLYINKRLQSHSLLSLWVLMVWPCELATHKSYLLHGWQESDCSVGVCCGVGGAGSGLRAEWGVGWAGLTDSFPCVAAIWSGIVYLSDTNPHPSLPLSALPHINSLHLSAPHNTTLLCLVTHLYLCHNFPVLLIIDFNISPVLGNSDFH